MSESQLAVNGAILGSSMTLMQHIKGNSELRKYTGTSELIIVLSADQECERCTARNFSCGNGQGLSDCFGASPMAV